MVAINWKERAILDGACTRDASAVDWRIMRELTDRIVPLTVADLPDKGIGWRVYPALFARAGATPASRATLEAAGGLAVDQPALFADLAEA